MKVLRLIYSLALMPLVMAIFVHLSVEAIDNGLMHLGKRVSNPIFWLFTLIILSILPIHFFRKGSYLYISTSSYALFLLSSILWPCKSGGCTDTVYVQYPGDSTIVVESIFFTASCNQAGEATLESRIEKKSTTEVICEKNALRIRAWGIEEFRQFKVTYQGKTFDFNPIYRPIFPNGFRCNPKCLVCSIKIE